MALIEKFPNEINRLINRIMPMNEKSVQLAALLRQVASLAFVDYWAPIELAGRTAARQLQVALPGRSQMNLKVNGH